MIETEKKHTTSELFATVRGWCDAMLLLHRNTSNREDHAAVLSALALLERRLNALENRDATTREACDLIHRAAERLRKDGAASTDELRAAEARGFERALTEAVESFPEGGRFTGTHVKSILRAIKDETP